MPIRKLWELLHSPTSKLMTVALVLESFPYMKLVDMGEGAWVKNIEENERYFVLKGYAPKGYVYSEVFHDTKKQLIVASGKVKETNSKIIKKSCDFPFKIGIEIDNGFKFLEDTTYYVRFLKK